ncbi:glycerol-3-phosphate acyltransferase [Candidatus Babeliales bacterium]|nr:glycerol-3-phosphate acyltransferase [Candidatus Babeliales bacterium]
MIEFLETNLLLFIGLFVCAYVVGSIPSGYWISRYFFNIDITQQGSKNIGATNVSRFLGKKYFFIIFFLDMFKASLFLLFCKFLKIDCLVLLLLAVVFLIGNSCSIFLNFRGGKGVATTAGLLLVLASNQVIMCFLILWIILLFLSKRVDVASLSAILLTTLFYFFFHDSIQYDFLYFLIFLTCWIFFRHKNNLNGFYQSFLSLG